MISNLWVVLVISPQSEKLMESLVGLKIAVVDLASLIADNLEQENDKVYSYENDSYLPFIKYRL
jgi:hypothetical protein